MGSQDRNRLEIRQPIGLNLDSVIVGTCSSNAADTDSLIDTYGMGRGGTNTYIGRQVYITESHGTSKAAAGDKSWVTASESGDATIAPALSGFAQADKGYELWKPPFLVEDVNDAINQAIIKASLFSLKVKQTEDTFTEENLYRYNCLTDFVGVHKVEYVSSIAKKVEIDNCDLVWTAGSANVTVTADKSFEKQGNACVKAVEDGNTGTNAIICYKAFSKLDLDECDKIEFWLYSSIALTAGQLQIKLDDTAAIASALESIDIPAMTAATWYRHVLTLANPHTDVDLISVGIFQVSNLGAYTLYVDQIDGVKADSRVYKELNSQHWELVKGTTNYLQLTTAGKSVTGDNTLLRISGYQNPALLSDDTTDSDVDPGWVIAYVTAWLLVSHAKSRFLDIQDRQGLAKYWLGEAQMIQARITTTYEKNYRSLE